MTTITSLLQQALILSQQSQQPIKKSDLAISSSSDNHINSANEAEDCLYCLEPMGEKNIIILECGHKTHMTCFMKHIIHNGGNIIRSSCSMCRALTISREIQDEIHQTRILANRQRDLDQQAYLNELRAREVGYDSDSDSDDELPTTIVNGLPIQDARREADRQRYLQRQVDEEARNRQALARYQVYRDNTRLTTLRDTWRMRRNSCGYRIVQILQNCNGPIRYGDIRRLLRCREGGTFTHQTFSTALRRLETTGYITHQSTNGNLTTITLVR
jgi:hypothetical protein